MFFYFSFLPTYSDRHNHSQSFVLLVKCRIELTGMYFIAQCQEKPFDSQWDLNGSSKSHHISVTSWGVRWRLKSPASRFFVQPFMQTQIKENIKATRHLPLYGEFAGHPVTGEFPTQRASNSENVSIWWGHHDLLYFPLLSNTAR